MSKEVNTLVDIISDLNHKLLLDEDLICVTDDDFNKIHEQVNKLRVNIYNHKEISNESKDRLEELTDIISTIPALNFSKRALVTGSDNHLDYIAIGLNLMSHHLEKRINPLLTCEKILNSIQDMVIVTDLKGNIQYVNPYALKVLKYPDKEIINKNIATIFRYPELLNLLNFINKDADIEVIDSEKLFFSVQMCASEMKDGTGKSTGLIYTAKAKAATNEKTIQSEKSIRIKIEKIDLQKLVQDVMKDISHHYNFELFDYKINVQQQQDYYNDKKQLSSIIRNLFIYSLFLRKGNYLDKYFPKPVLELTIKTCDNGILINVFDNGNGIDVEGKPCILLDGLCKTTIAEDKDLALYFVKESVKLLKGKYGVGMRYSITVPNEN
jgi:PAS domain S-box-containing protein